MADNFVQDGKKMSIATASGLSSGDPYMMGDYRPCVLLTDAATASPYTASVQFDGVFDLSVKGENASGNSAVAIGDAIFYTVGDTPKLNKKSTGKHFGVALEAVSSGETDTIKVLLNPVYLTAASVNAAALASDAVITAKILDANVTAAKLAADSVITEKILDANVTSGKIADEAVTNAKLGFPKIGIAQETVTFADFDTEAGSVVFDTAMTIPKGAVVLRTTYDSVTKFEGGTVSAATLTAGDSDGSGGATNADRYMTGTPDVFADADVLDAGAVSGTALHTADTDVSLTLALTGGNGDDLTAGEVTVTIFYLVGVDHSA